ncbi:serine/threonine-protein phosphatase [Arcanobacterium haemolyticum]|uniref:Protein serine/threonine phosphatase n=1 Tax=Arcanobacterium haemolyticum (strain ATCC 9345 / DSM 20595 / CCM 5947 / CCUG 17215 / LMG 16163 / NBRC 15585 / NCTC 8452 / 11018) TaxID=644284 RepID=D7BLS0_ARCHD|nr:protein phosphatase 2C domain-containing protein [Arcanobacterium haemolyticum]ADH91869.1 protein serine/threonine phosphatase [Arcanobacterium haemolyticum DSM 20595]QCX46054.1 serine/threonine-protein phosphatase [Arcanobacterium haemolyticum]SPT75517.1 PP2C-family Ser/Thr phosphatase [Arcanobacterium haemolyticum]SQH27110.1 PP2C-family Ser/Thr phosphatase [Arcanobacterium haemolyticum]
MIRFEYAAFSDVGLVRKSNQDAGYASSHLLVLADGMGGAAGGDVASSVVVGQMAQIDDSHQAEDLLPLLKRQLNQAQNELLVRVAENPELAGLGTTCIAILRTANKLGMVHVGDSRAYLLRQGRLTQITRDHTLVQYLVDHGQLSPEEALHHPKRHVIMRNVGDASGPVEADSSVREALPGDRWLLSSDGLFDVVSDETIEDTLRSYRDVDECGERLIDLALAGGAPDNVTIVLADVIDDSGTGSSYDRGPLVVGSAAVDRRKPTRAGSSSAGQLAALAAASRPAVAPVEDDDDDAAPPRRRWIARLAAWLVVVVALAVGLGAGYMWTQSRYYVAADQGKVVIFKGIPQTVGPLELSEKFEETGIMVKNLNPVARQRLDMPITRSSLEEARQVVKDLAAQKLVVQNPVKQPSPFSPSVVPPPGYQIPEQNDPMGSGDSR